jgi:hypothetical protein
MKKTLVFIFFTISISGFSQTQNSGVWIVTDTFSVENDFTSLIVWVDSNAIHPSDTSFAPILNDSIRNQYTYIHAPHLIQFNQYNVLVLTYGNILDPESRIITKERMLWSNEGDCIFAWEPSTSMYEYVITWSKDHYVYYTSGGTEYHYEPFDPEILSQQQQQKLIPQEEMMVYFQGRLRPISDHYHCNIPDAKK